MSKYEISLGVGIAAVALALLFSFTSENVEQQWFSFDVNKTNGIPRRTWQSLIEEACPNSACESPHFAVEYIQENYYEPIVFTKTPSLKWKATKRWRSSKNLPSFHTLVQQQRKKDKKGAEALFIYQQDRRPLVSFLQKTYSPSPKRKTRTPASKFFKKSSEVGNLYFSNSLTNLTNFPDYNKDVWVLENDIDTEFLEPYKNTSSRVIWIGNDGSTANAHYDADTNFFAQIVGKKRFILFSPNQFSKLHVHPLYHPRNRQTQWFYCEKNRVSSNTKKLAGLCPLEDDGNEDDDGDGFEEVAKQQEAHETVEPWGYTDLGPGDVLYLPAFWFHRVTSLSAPTISFTSWSQYGTAATAKIVYKWSLPEELKNQTYVTPQLLMGYLHKIIETTMEIIPEMKADYGDSKTFFQNIWQNRYNFIMLKHESKLRCYKTLSKRGCSRRLAIPDSLKNSTLMEKYKENATALDKLAETFARNAFGDCPAANTYRKGSIGLMLGDMIEKAISMVVGPTEVCYTLRCAGLGFI